MKRAVLCACGPSMAASVYDLGRLVQAGYEQWVVGDSYQFGQPSLIYHADKRWWDEYYGAVVERCPDARMATLSDRASKRYGLEHRRYRNQRGLGKDLLHTGGNSGYQLINWAYLEGYEEIVLLGYDMQHTDGRAHWFGDHPNGWDNATAVDGAVPRYRNLANDLRGEGVTVFNCSAATALDCFPRPSVDEVLV